MGDGHNVSEQNSRKLDHLIEQVTGMIKQCNIHNVSLFGENGRLGLAQKVSIMWGIHTWILVATSGSLGSLVTYMVMKGAK